ncbi:hypothetical protein JY651_07485 [Pyxidicoccus parkwayensis]|uniref:BioF2-like acetyltransferase domain-containing protein n=1 Tax=Pyxidicoccus parkwayensis TaxID=2813578 RepID=A0ABX7P2V1_9BACT|nr:hypothetical protein [Pyxidicoccus parkwaysis]QSQ24776.1 hypothetical protein JY651_07485 [Pyxidicoccus parkwaysis]
MGMAEVQVREASVARVPVLTERELAERRREEGVRVLEHGGHYWEQVGAPGFFQPIHLLAGLTPQEVTRPAPWCWGYRAALTPETADAANGFVPIVRSPGLDTYDVDSLSANRRNKLRKCQRLVRIVQLTGPALLLEQGYDTVVDALSRTEHKKVPSRAAYAADVKKYFQGAHWCVLAGLVDGRLGGYLDGYAVDGIAYGVCAYYATWALPTNLATGLVFEFAQACRRGGIRMLVNGLHSREVPSLNQFKDDMGFVVERVPIRWSMNPLARALIRRHRAHAYYRLTGQA